MSKTKKAAIAILSVAISLGLVFFFAKKTAYQDSQSGLHLKVPLYWHVRAIDDSFSSPIDIRLPAHMGFVKFHRYVDGFFSIHSVKRYIEVIGWTSESVEILSAEQVKMGGTIGVHIVFNLVMKEGTAQQHLWSFAKNGMVYQITGSGFGPGKVMLPLGLHSSMKALQFSKNESAFPGFLKTPDNLDLQLILSMHDPVRIAKTRELDQAVFENKALSILDDLLAQGADINHLSGKCSGFLRHAVKTDHLELMKWLLDNDIQLFSYADNSLERFESIYQEAEKYPQELVPSQKEMDLLREHYNQDPRGKARAAMTALFYPPARP